MRTTIYLHLVLLFPLFACGDPAAPTATRVDPTTAAELRLGGRDFLFIAHDRLNAAIAEDGPVAGMHGFLRFDASYNHPGEALITGRGAITDYLAAFYSSTTANHLTYHPLVADVSTDGRLGFSFGWSEEARDGVAGVGRFIFVWKRALLRWKLQAINRAEATEPASPPPDDARILDLEPGLAVWGLPAAAAAEISAADYAFAELSMDEGFSVAFATYADSAGVVFGANGIYYNQEVIEQVYGGWTPAQTLRWAPIRAGSAASGDLGWSVGYSTYIFEIPDSDPYVSPGKYLTVWRRAETGKWRYLVDGGSPGR